MFKNLIAGATSKMIATSAVASLLVSGLVVSTAFAVASTYNSHHRDNHNTLHSLQAESAGGSYVTIGSGSVWPASQESTSVDITESSQGALPSESNNSTELGSQPSTDNTNQSKNDSGSASGSQTENSTSNSPEYSSDKPSYGATDSQNNQPSQNTEDTGSSQSQSSGYNYLLNVSGYCDGGWDCAQAAVNSYSLSYIYYAPNFQMIAGHNYGEAGFIANFAPGDIIKVTGNGAGLYRITHTQWMEYTTDVQQVGGQFAFQTCVGSKMLHAYAVKIG